MGFETQEDAERFSEWAELRADQLREERLLTPSSHVYKRAVKREPNPEVTVREMVTKYGDNWRLMMQTPHGFNWRDQMTFDRWEATNMKNMETGLFPRIRHEDLYSSDD